MPACSTLLNRGIRNALAIIPKGAHPGTEDGVAIRSAIVDGRDANPASG